MLHPAALPEGGRGVALARGEHGAAPAHGPGRLRPGAHRQLRERGHGRVRHGRQAELLLPGDEHPPAGGAPGHRDGHRARPGGVAAAHRQRRAAALRPAGHPLQRLGHRGAHLRRGADPRLHPLHRHDHPLLRPARRGRAGGQRRQHRRQDRRVLRLHAGQAHLPRQDPRGRAARAGRGAQRLPHRGREHEHRLRHPGALPARIRRGQPAHRLHRSAFRRRPGQAVAARPVSPPDRPGRHPDLPHPHRGGAQVAAAHGLGDRHQA